MKVFFRFAILCLPFLLSSCSTFNREWRQAGMKAARTGEITGRWDGRWHSGANGHNGQLRAIVTAAGTHHCDVKFDAAFAHWVTLFITVHADYIVRMEVGAATNGVSFRGSKDLGFFAGGTYTYEGWANVTNFFSTYKSKYDHGTFQMQRR
jgi:hypothetical protein